MGGFLDLAFRESLVRKCFLDSHLLLIDGIVERLNQVN